MSEYPLRLLAICCFLPSVSVAGSLSVEEDPDTGGLSAIRIAGDETGMNWIHRADGKTLAWVLPDRVNGTPARFRDPLANDQDWALVFYLRQYK